MFKGLFIYQVLAVLVLVSVLTAAGAGFEPYRVILEREIFGRRPAPVVASTAAADAAVQKRAEQLAKRLTMCAVNRTPSGNVAVGFIDNEVKPPRNIYLNVGESADGYTIIEADYSGETATIEKEGVTITLKLGQGLVNVGAPVPAPVAVAGGRVAQRLPPTPNVAESAGGNRGVQRAVRGPAAMETERGVRRFGGQFQDSERGAPGSYRDSLQAREQRERGLREAEERMAREKFAELAREVAEAEVRRQMLAEQGLTEEDLLYDQEMADDEGEE